MTNVLASRPALEISPGISLHRIGIDPISHVTVMEDHDEALRVWQQRHFSNRILLHIDAHIDFDWIPERPLSDLLSASSIQELETLAQQKVFWDFTDRGAASFVHIGNYICLALQQKILRSFYWITPEAPPGVSWQKEMKILFQEFQTRYPQAFTEIQIEETVAQARLYGLPLFTYPFGSFPSIEEKVLLDIDTDFLISGFLEDFDEDPASKKPWLFPEELIASLQAKGIRSDCVTLAYSVEGGFTPLSYKYFGDALAQLIRDPAADRTTYLLKKTAQASFAKGNVEGASSEYEKALSIDPKDAASLYNLSLLCLGKGETVNASRVYHEAIAADASYATSYNNFGPSYLNLAQWEKAKEAFEKMLILDPENANALCGLGDALRCQKKFSEALGYYEKALLKQPDLAEAYCGLGAVFFAKRKWDQALSAFQRALALKGLEARLRFWIGATLFKKKQFKKAKETLLEAARLGLHPFLLHRYLAWIYFREGLYYKMMREIRKIFLLFRQEVRFHLLRLFYHYV